MPAEYAYKAAFSFPINKLFFQDQQNLTLITEHIQGHVGLFSLSIHLKLHTKISLPTGIVMVHTWFLLSWSSSWHAVTT